MHQVTVTILPQKYFVDRIGGGKFKVNVIIPAGQDPHTYEITPGQLGDVGRSSIYFMIGYFPYEIIYMNDLRSLNPAMNVVNTSKGIKLIRGSGDDHHGGGRHGGVESGIDPHTWVSASCVKIMAGHILSALSKIDPGNAALFASNNDAFITDIDKIDTYIKNILSYAKQKKIIVFHPGWAYFARDYGLEQFSVEIEGKEPSPYDVRKIIDLARESGIRTIFIQKQFPVSMAEAIAGDIGGNVERLDPLEYDWVDNIKKTGLAIRNALVPAQGRREGE
jgi:zinc transport system substrate-binding protein